MRVIKLKKGQFKVGKDGKVVRVHAARDAAHAVAMRKSKKQRVVRRAPA